jgi:protein-S-isoprenylcysteine O-methyltransferase Ste14
MSGFYLLRAVVILVSLVIAAIEFRIFSRERLAGGLERDRGSLAWLLASVVASLAAVIILGRLGVGRVSPGVSYLGFLLAIGGFVLRQWSIRTLGRFFTPVVSLQRSQCLVVEGPYARLRHPGYTGLLLEVSGMVLAATNALAAVLAVCFVYPALCYRIRVEEQALIDRFGDKYRLYQTTTGSLVPLLY